jgi:hypothetical protein
LLNGEIEGGIDVVLGLADGDYLGIPEDHHLMPEGVYEDALKVVEMIKTREIQVPSTAAEYESFIASL